MLNMVNHWQNNHTNCNKQAECSKPRYLPTRDLITNKSAAKKLTETLKKSKVFQFAEGMLLGVTTSDDESLNNVLGTWIEKRVNFSTIVYALRVGIVVLKWNENTVNRGTRKQGFDWMNIILQAYFAKLCQLM